MSDTNTVNVSSNPTAISEITETEPEFLVVDVDPGHFRTPDGHDVSLDVQSDPLEPTVSVTSPIVAAASGIPLSYYANVDLDTADMGHMNLRLMENDYCKMVPNKLIRLQRSVGVLSVLVFSKNLGAGIEVLLRGMLLRANPELRHIPVDFVCQRHVNDAGPAGRTNVLQAATGPLSRVSYGMHGMRRSVAFHLGCTGGEGTVSTSVDFRSVCDDDCNTSNHPRVSSLVGPRFMILLITLEAVGTGEVLARRRIALQTYTPTPYRGIPGRNIPRGIERPPPPMYRPPRENPRPVVAPATLVSMNGLDTVLKGVVMIASQLGISLESLMSRVQQLYVEMGVIDPTNRRTQ